MPLIFSGQMHLLSRNSFFCQNIDVNICDFCSKNKNEMICNGNCNSSGNMNQLR